MPEIGDVALYWLERDSRARFIIDQGLRILWRNQPALDLVTLITSIRLDESLLFATVHQREQLIAALESMEDAQCTWWLPTAEPSNLVALRITRADPVDRTLYAVEMFTDNPLASRHYVDVSDGYNLTASECAVLQGLREGLAPQELADTRHIGIETVRAHIRNVYGKLNVRNREQLFHRMSAFRC